MFKMATPAQPNPPPQPVPAPPLQPVGSKPQAANSQPTFLGGLNPDKQQAAPKTLLGTSG